MLIKSPHDDAILRAYFPWESDLYDNDSSSPLSTISLAALEQG